MKNSSMHIVYVFVQSTFHLVDTLIHALFDAFTFAVLLALTVQELIAQFIDERSRS